MSVMAQRNDIRGYCAGELKAGLIRRETLKHEKVKVKTVCR